LQLPTDHRGEDTARLFFIAEYEDVQFLPVSFFPNQCARIGVPQHDAVTPMRRPFTQRMRADDEPRQECVREDLVSIAQPDLRRLPILVHLWLKLREQFGYEIASWLAVHLLARIAELERAHQLENEAVRLGRIVGCGNGL